MLSEFEKLNIEGYANDFIGSPDVKAMAKRLLELDAEIKTALEEKENAIREKENAEEMVAEATGKLIAAESESQLLGMQIGDLTEEKDALLEELDESRQGVICICGSMDNEPYTTEIFGRMRKDILSRGFLDSFIHAIEETEKEVVVPLKRKNK